MRVFKNSYFHKILQTICYREGFNYDERGRLVSYPDETLLCQFDKVGKIFRVEESSPAKLPFVVGLNLQHSDAIVNS